MSAEEKKLSTPCPSCGWLFSIHVHVENCTCSGSVHDPRCYKNHCLGCQLEYDPQEKVDKK